MAHNGGRSQDNLTGIGGNEFPCINHLKTARTLFAAGGYAFPAILSANGYPQSTPASVIATTTNIPNTATRYTGSWIVDWVGIGKLSLIGGGYSVSEGASFLDNPDTTNNMAMTGTNGRIKFTFNSTATTASLQLVDSNAGTPLSSVRLYRADQETNLVTNGEIWNPVWLAKRRELNCGSLRFMDWSFANNC